MQRLMQRSWGWAEILRFWKAPDGCHCCQARDRTLTPGEYVALVSASLPQGLPVPSSLYLPWVFAWLSSYSGLSCNVTAWKSLVFPDGPTQKQLPTSLVWLFHVSEIIAFHVPFLSLFIRK